MINTIRPATIAMPTHLTRREQAPEPPELPEPLLVDVIEAARLLALGKSTVRLLVRRGEIATVHVGAAMRIEVEELRRFVERHRDL